MKFYHQDIAMINNINILFTLTKREFESRYLESYLGAIWAFINPLVMLFIYTFVFGFIFKLKWNLDIQLHEYGLYIYSGLIIYYFFSDSVMRSADILIYSSNLIKKLNFNVLFIPLSLLLSNLINLLIGIIILFIAKFAITGEFNLNLIFLPFVLFPLMAFILGLIFLISSISVYLKDLKQILIFLTSSLIFLTPIFYPLDVIPEKYVNFLYINPLTHYVEYIHTIFFGTFEINPLGIIILWFLSFLFCILSYIFFLRVKKGFADVI